MVEVFTGLLDNSDIETTDWGCIFFARLLELIFLEYGSVTRSLVKPRCGLMQSFG